MPIYRGKECSDFDLDGLKAAYRYGYKGVNDNVEESDQVIIDRLTEQEVDCQPHAFDLGKADGQASE